MKESSLEKIFIFLALVYGITCGITMKPSVSLFVIVIAGASVLALIEIKLKRYLLKRGKLKWE